MYVGGYFTADDDGDWDGVIGQFNSSGTAQAVLPIGDQESNTPDGNQSDQVTGIAVDSHDDIYVTGDFQGKGVNFNDLGNSSTWTARSKGSSRTHSSPSTTATSTWCGRTDSAAAPRPPRVQQRAGDRLVG